MYIGTDIPLWEDSQWYIRKPTSEMAEIWKILCFDVMLKPYTDYVYTTVRGFTVVYQKNYVYNGWGLKICGLMRCLEKNYITDYEYTMVRGFTVVYS